MPNSSCPSTQNAYTRDGFGVPAAQLMHKIISVPPAREAIKRTASSDAY